MRLLTDAKTKRSRGMAFVECETAEALYARAWPATTRIWTGEG